MSESWILRIRELRPARNRRTLKQDIPDSCVHIAAPTVPLPITLLVPAGLPAVLTSYIVQADLLTLGGSCLVSCPPHSYGVEGKKKERPGKCGELKTTIKKASS